MLRRPEGLSGEQSQKRYSPVCLSRPMTSGSPPVRSISLSDQSALGLRMRRACTSSHSRPSWRLRFFSKRFLSVLSSSSRCCLERLTKAIAILEITIAGRRSRAPLDGHEREIVGVGRVGEGAHVTEAGGDECSGRLGALLVDKARDALHAVLLARCAACLGEAIGKEKKRIAGIEPEARNRELALEKHAKREAHG